jgi:hypothetical protein
MNRVWQDGRYLIRGILGTWVGIGAVAVVVEALLLIVNAIAPGRWSEVLEPLIPPTLPLGLFLTTVTQGIYLTILVQLRFIRRAWALKTMTWLAAIALSALILSVLA